MLTTKQVDRYADVLLWGLETARRNRFRKGDIVLIRYDRPALPLAEILFARLLEKGLHPIQRMNPTTTMEKSFFTQADDRQLAFNAPGDVELIAALNGSIFLHAPESMTHLSDVASEKISRSVVSKRFIRETMEKRESEGKLGWTLCTMPTDALASHAGMSLSDYGKLVAKACFLNRKDPVSHWREIHRTAGAIKNRLDRLKVAYFRIESDHVDLQIVPGEQRRWLGISGRNIPSFEIFLSPDWRGTRGVYYADQPSYRSGNLVKGVRIEFEKGNIKMIGAESGEAFLQQQVAMDPGAGRLGEFSLTDKRFSKIDRFMANTLFDENYGGKNGNCHIALGSSYASSFKGDPKKLKGAMKKSLGFNESALHWDLVNTEKKRVAAHLKSGRIVTVYENGMFVL